MKEVFLKRKLSSKTDIKAQKGDFFSRTNVINVLNFIFDF